MKGFSFSPTRIIIGLALIAVQSLAQSNSEPYTFTTFAGGGGFDSPDQTGTAVRLNVPAGVAVDKTGSVYVADTFKHAIRKVTRTETNWIMTTLAGQPGTSGSSDGIGA